MSRAKKPKVAQRGGPSAAQTLERLAELGAESLSFSPGAVTAYDVEHYRRIPRKPVAWGEHVERDIAPSESAGPVRVPRGCRGSRPYLLRIGGFRREGVFGADEIASALVHAGIRYADGVGNGLLESLLLCRKYGIWPTFEAPALGFELPFAKADFPAFLRFYRRKLLAMRDHLRTVEHVLGRKLVGRKHQPWLLWLRYSPLALYAYALDKNAKEIRREMLAEIGMEAAPAAGGSAADRAEVARFWAYVRRRHAELLLEMARLFREEIVGEGLILGNMHANPIVDYATIGMAFDHPGVAVRPTYLDDPATAESTVAFTVQLFRELTGKAPIVSVRTNLLSAGSRYIPGRNLVKRWYGAALRSGAAGFYLWPRDYPGGDDGTGYDGPMPGHPDPSARGRERWDDQLGTLARMGDCRTFIPPESEVGLLTSWRTFGTDEWLKAFQVFALLSGTRVRCRFQEAESLETGAQSLSRYRLLVVPTLPFCSDALFVRLGDYLGAGGVVLSGQRSLAACDEFGRPRRASLRLRRLSSFEHLAGQAWYEPALTKAGPSEASAELGAALHGLCAALRVPRGEWVYDLTVDNLAGSLGRLPRFDALAPSPTLTLEHYLYEHSSNWILPEYRRRPEESFRRAS